MVIWRIGLKTYVEVYSLILKFTFMIHGHGLWISFNVVVYYLGL